MTDQSPCLEPTNVQRAQWAKNALAVFTAETYGGDHPNTMHSVDLESAIGDLICDLLHFARFHPRMDAVAIHSHALRMFEQEVAEEANCECRYWSGQYHDTQCPVSLAAEAATRRNQSSDSTSPFPEWLDVLLDIKRLAEKSGDHEADPFALLDMIAYKVHAALKRLSEVKNRP